MRRPQWAVVQTDMRPGAGEEPPGSLSTDAAGAPEAGLVMIGYASGSGAEGTARRELEAQADLIERECTRRGLKLMEVVYEREPSTGKALTRPGLTYALRRISAGEATGLVVAELSRLTRSVAELGTILDGLRRENARLIGAAQGFDSGAADGRLAADLLVEVAQWERARLSERTRIGLRAARSKGRPVGRPSVSDDPDLSKRIAQMRAAGMTLQAIADQLNQEGVPTLRGGAKWRHSSVQAAAGYRRPAAK